MELQRLDWVSAPDISGKTPQQAIEILQQHAFESAQRIMALTNELIDLKARVDRITRGY